MRNYLPLLVVFFLTACKSPESSRNNPSTPAPGTAISSHDYCDPALARTDALDNPSKHAWDLFVTLNHPAKGKTVARGEPDCSKPIGTPGTTAVWETFRNAASEVYLSNGAEPPDWQDASLPDEEPGTVPPKAVDASGQEIRSFHGIAQVPEGKHHMLRGIHPQFSPDGIFNNKGGFGETRLNKTTYDFIRDQCLFSVEGQQRYAKAVVDSKKSPISFPVESIEVKAAWLDFEKEKIPQDKWNTYYTADYNHKKYGLVALHILTKDVPNWFWASFHHKDSPGNLYEVKDTYGQPKILAGTVWENYRLGGTQTDFVNPTGTATKLSDYYVEFGFQRSSCITCHATATISPTSSMPGAQPRALCAITPDLPDAGLALATCQKILGQDAFIPGTNQLRIERGVPDPVWYEKNGKPYFLQTDFVWSITFRGRPEKSPPPARCIWEPSH